MNPEEYVDTVRIRLEKDGFDITPRPRLEDTELSKIIASGKYPTTWILTKPTKKEQKEIFAKDFQNALTERLNPLKFDLFASRKKGFRGFHDLISISRVDPLTSGTVDDYIRAMSMLALAFGDVSSTNPRTVIPALVASSVDEIASNHVNELTPLTQLNNPTPHYFYSATPILALPVLVSLATSRTIFNEKSPRFVARVMYNRAHEMAQGFLGIQ